MPGSHLEQFKTTGESQQKMDDLSLASQVKTALVESYPDIAVTCEYGNVLVYTKAEEHITHKLETKVKSLAQEIDGIHHIEVHSRVPIPPNAV